ncbi:KGGVGR-motif variant AAA ATPase [Azospirillum sp. ST 5-10]|uniref:KGGVGR-motif variant AAA ATPase n=1 Tax=unclassified Azospirillum TaxID=2630922 RepID=UPI003F4A60DB
MFDDALDNANTLIVSWIGDGRIHIPQGRFIVITRDPFGRCGVVLPVDDAFGEGSGGIDGFRDALRPLLGRHGLPGDDIALLPGEHIAPNLIFDDPTLVLVDRSEPRIRLLDRLQTNQDWLRPPLRVQPVLPLGVGFSIKGGVGRSTALAVLALALARDGHRVTVIDLDLEAPGMGALLLGEDLPDFGVVDWLTEALVGDAPASLVDDFRIRAPAVNANGFSGDVQVIPAYGHKTRDYVAKVGRVYMPTAFPDHGLERLADRLDRLVSTLARDPTPPDVVLIDARAGLHDTGAAVVTQLGAQVFLFGRDEPQNWDAYGRWLDHLRRSAQIGTSDEYDDLRLRLKCVASMLEDVGESQERWRRRSYETWQRIYDEGDGPYSFIEQDEAAPHFPLPTAFTAAVRRANLTDRTLEDQWALIGPAFQAFIGGAKELLLLRNDGA